VVIGDEICPVIEYNLALSSRGEAATCTITMALENIDSRVFANEEETGMRVPVKVYSGYLDDRSDINNVISKIYNASFNGQKIDTSKFSLRFDGFAAQPEWQFGDERTLRLLCFDWSQPLREYKWDQNFKNSDAEVSSVLNAIQRRIPGIQIVADSIQGSNRLGERDAETGEYSYSASGRSFWEVLMDCAGKVNKRVFIEGSKIYITRYMQDPSLWSLYYGPQGSVDLSKNMLFKNLTLRYGEVGESSKTNVVVDLYSSKLSKKGKERKSFIRYPENAPIKENTRHIKMNIGGNRGESELNAIAQNIYQRLSRKIMTGNADIPFANHNINVFDLVQFVSTKEYSELSFVKDYYFSINSITENYSVEGYTQTIDIDTDPDINKDTVTQRIAPPKVNIKPSNSLGSTPIFIGDLSILNKRIGE
jgi:hypothetical protein